jgi:THO complex subunit 5
MIIAKLKKFNRLDKLRLQSRRDTLQKEKLQVDSNLLKLQNLIYESDHLKREINKCYSFKSEDEDIDLVGMEEFLELAPETSKSDEILSDEHSLRKARLGFELIQRKEYAQQCKELEKDKEEVAKKTIEVKKNLDSLSPSLQEVKKSTRPIQQILNMPFEKEWEIQKLVRLLPQPLYMAYIKLVAYSEVIDKKISVSIEGDEEEAKLIELERKQSKTETSDGEDSENDIDENDYEEGVNHRKIKRRQSKIESMNQKREQLFKHHPLSVQFNINMKDKPEFLSIAMNYLPQLGFVTVQGKFNIETNGSIAAGDVITQERILTSLYANDLGIESPNSKTTFQLQSLQLGIDDLNRILEEKKLGKPYKWAQRLCGIIFLSQFNMKESQKLCEETVPDLIRQIRRKLKARMQLYSQIKSLEIGKVSSVTPVRISCILQLFVPLTYIDYCAEGSTKRFTQRSLVDENDVFYRGIITRGSAKLECYICIPATFPSNYPIFAINLSWNDNRYNAENSPHLRQIEHFINSLDVASVDTILTQQLERAMTSLDIFLETESSQQLESAEFHQEMNFSSGFKGKERSRPYRSKSSSGIISFSHI